MVQKLVQKLVQTLVQKMVQKIVQSIFYSMPNSAHAPLNRDDGGLLPVAYLHLVRKKAAN